VTITYADSGSSAFKPLKTVTADARGYFKFNSVYKAGRRWSIRWTTFAGTPVGAYQR
jgi:hypothetical protein